MSFDHAPIGICGKHYLNVSDARWVEKQEVAAVWGLSRIDKLDNGLRPDKGVGSPALLNFADDVITYVL